MNIRKPKQLYLLNINKSFKEVSDIIKLNYGFNVRLSDDMDEDTMGRIFYKDKTILISNNISEVDKVLTIVHEGGHMLHFLRSGNKKKPEKIICELFAYYYGWLFNIKHNIGISKDIWRYFNMETIKLFL